jgi:hypothetical protein
MYVCPVNKNLRPSQFYVIVVNEMLLMQTAPGVHRLLLELASQGVSAREIARATGIPERAVELILRSPLAQGELARRAS